MKKLITIFIGILIIIFISILYMDYNNQKYISKLENRIIKNTNIKNIKYINSYDEYYIIIDDNNLYVFDDKYVELLKVDKILLHPNDKNYDIIYNDGRLMYMNNYYKDNKLYFEYYDVYSYEIINEVLVGGSYE